LGGTGDGFSGSDTVVPNSEYYQMLSEGVWDGGVVEMNGQLYYVPEADPTSSDNIAGSVGDFVPIDFISDETSSTTGSCDDFFIAGSGGYSGSDNQFPAWWDEIEETTSYGFGNITEVSKTIISGGEVSDYLDDTIQELRAMESWAEGAAAVLGFAGACLTGGAVGILYGLGVTGGGYSAGATFGDLEDAYSDLGRAYNPGDGELRKVTKSIKSTTSAGMVVTYHRTTYYSQDGTEMISILATP
jgi:hypothetical protein